MRRGGLAAAVGLVALIAGCTSGTEEGATEMVTTTDSTTESTTGTTTESEPTAGSPLPRIDAGRPASGGPLDVEAVVTGLDSPTFATAAPGQPRRLYIVEQTGRIRIVVLGQERDRLLEESYLDLSSRVSTGNEQGLLSVAFHPSFETNGLLYVNYTDVEGDTRVIEFREPSPGAALVEVRELLYVPQPYANHNGGQLAFGPDGLLYVGLGDGGSAGDPENHAQDLSSRLGKILRLDVDGTSTEWEMFGYGLRNPWRFSFDRVTGDLWIGDVGQGALEEIDFVSAPDLGGRYNFGWDVYEGSELFEDKPLTPGGILVEPRIEYTHAFGCSVSGGYVYRGMQLRKQAWGRYFYGDYCSGRIWSSARWNGEVTRRGHPFRVPELTSFGEDLNGELYLLSRNGTVYRLVKAM
ncbi:MAG: PQQ-dependent sugar dehydrogenase [Gaiellaceae bacterium]